MLPARRATGRNTPTRDRRAGVSASWSPCWSPRSA